MTLLPKQEKKYLTFLFSDTSIKITKIEEKNQKRWFQMYFEIPLPPGIIVDSEVKDPSKLAAIINEIKIKTKVTENSLIVGVPEIKASIHTLFLPKLTPREIGEAIKNQADSFLPFSYQDEYIDWKYWDDQNPDSSRILVCAIPKNIVDSYVVSLNKVGFDPVAFESTSLSLLRLVPEVSPKSCLAAEVSDTMTVLVINDEGGIETSSVATDKDQFLITIKKIIDYYYRSQKDEEVLKVYLCGKGVNKELFGQIQQLKGQPILLKSGIEGIVPEKEPELAVLASLAQKKVSPIKDVTTINILPPTLTERYGIEKQQSLNRKLKIVLLFLFLCLNLATFIIFSELKPKLDKLASQIESNGYNQFQNLGKYNQRSNLINLTSGKIVLLQKVIAEISQPSQQNTQITGISYSDQQQEIALSGLTSSKDNLLQYKSFLENTHLFTRVSISLPSLREETNLNFRMILKL